MSLRGGFGLYFGNSFQNIPLFMEQQANPTIFQTVLSLSDPVHDIAPCTGEPLGSFSFTPANIQQPPGLLARPSSHADRR